MPTDAPAQSTTWQAPFAISKIDEPRRLVFGWLSVAKTADGADVVDLQGDVIPEGELENAAYDFVLNARGADEMHREVLKGALVESMAFTADKQAAMGIPAGTVPVGWWVGFRVAPDTFAKVQAQELRAFSIGGIANREAISG